MNKNCIKLSVLLLGLIFFLVSSCKEHDQIKATSADEHAKLIKKRSPGNVQTSLEDKNGMLWFGTTDNGLYRYDGTKFHQILKNNKDKINAISCLFEDQDGAIWIGTENGLFVYKGKSLQKITIPLPVNQAKNKNKYYGKSKAIFNIIQTKDRKIWFATINGVFTYDGKSFTPFVINKNGGGYLNTNNNIEYMLEDKSGNIWFGGRGNQGVYRYDGKSTINLKLQELTLQFGTRKVNHNWAWPQLQDKNGDIWFSNWAGVYRYNGVKFTSLTKKDGLPGYNGLVSKIIEDKNGILWFGGDAGLSRFDGKKFINYKKELANPWIWTILEDKNGALWVGTRDTGLYLFDGTTFFNYTEERN
ncbi:hypothetical protein L1S34_07185 [Flavobacterium sp. K77]|uniref:ligand-binding sensor domain-containing protein n=1 Tax=Flavobacterium sp. K77 TaxID=2910676 RepID=UPI001F28FE05|nr:two-component regulator propeller domain-containing protein [Flavobacterium sp. K77]MCF6141064.1 hypothetical protein [Flavobacterium sp. K77]